MKNRVEVQIADGLFIWETNYDSQEDILNELCSLIKNQIKKITLIPYHCFDKIDIIPIIGSLEDKSEKV